MVLILDVLMLFDGHRSRLRESETMLPSCIRASSHTKVTASSMQAMETSYARLDEWAGASLRQVTKRYQTRP
jgi:hypothetical protein